MTYRLLDLLWSLALLALCFSSTALLLYAIWNIGQEALRGVHAYLTCRDYAYGNAWLQGLLLQDRVANPILRLQWPWQRLAPIASRRQELLEQLADFRWQAERRRKDELIWDPYLGALLTPAEHAHLYPAE